VGLDTVAAAAGTRRLDNLDTAAAAAAASQINWRGSWGVRVVTPASLMSLALSAGCRITAAIPPAATAWAAASRDLVVLALATLLPLP